MYRCMAFSFCLTSLPLYLFTSKLITLVIFTCNILDVLRNGCMEGWLLFALPLYFYTSLPLVNYSLISLCNFQCTNRCMEGWMYRCMAFSFCLTSLPLYLFTSFNACALKVKYHINLMLQELYSSFVQITDKRCIEEWMYGGMTFLLYLYTSNISIPLIRQIPVDFKPLLLMKDLI